MILILGIPSESPVSMLTDACRADQLPFVLFNQRTQARWRLDTDNNQVDNSLFTDGEREVRFANLTGIYLRTMDHTKIPEYENSPQKAQIEAMYLRLFKLLDVVTIPRVVNPPSPMMSNGSKPYQAMIIRDHGLSIPETCITSNREVAAEFIARYGSVIYKSISGARSIVTKTTPGSLEQLEKIRFCPVQFQECVQGENIRVHVVGEKLFATRIISEAVDYRYGHQEGKTAKLEPYTPDAELSAKCLRLAATLRLPFAGIDLMMARDGRTICFEVNPSPGYSYYESHTHQPISHALAAYLGQGRGRGRGQGQGRGQVGQG